MEIGGNKLPLCCHVAGYCLAHEGCSCAVKSLQNLSECSHECWEQLQGQGQVMFVVYVLRVDTVTAFGGVHRMLCVLTSAYSICACFWIHL